MNSSFWIVPSPQEAFPTFWLELKSKGVINNFGTLESYRSSVRIWTETSTLIWECKDIGEGPYKLPNKKKELSSARVKSQIDCVSSWIRPVLSFFLTYLLDDDCSCLPVYTWYPYLNCGLLQKPLILLHKLPYTGLFLYLALFLLVYNFNFS